VALRVQNVGDIFRKVSINKNSEPEAPAGALPMRRIADAPTLRALAHPVRLAILEALGDREPLTATEAAQVVGESPSACSFHLRMLAKYGLVVADEAIGRRRPWRRRDPSGFVFPAVDDDPQTSLAAGALSDLVWSRLLERARAVLAARPRMSAGWQAITSAAQTVAYVTPEEAEQFTAELWAVIGRFQDRLEDPSRRPPGSLPLEIVLVAYPRDAATPAG
jgi:DNA-binding transcriptional ArsR family regulator